jgi:hypothetical protein
MELGRDYEFNKHGHRLVMCVYDRDDVYMEIDGYMFALYGDDLKQVRELLALTEDTCQE